MLRQTNKKKQLQPILMETNPKSPFSEAYRKLRTNIEFSSVGMDVKVLMVSSSQGGEGKSYTSVNLAVSHAQTGKRTILIDADMRAPSLHKMLSKNNTVGLSSYLALQVPLEQIVEETHIPNLSFIPSGKTPPNAAELLSMKQLDLLLDRLKESYDIIIIDTPPVLAVADAQIIAARTDGVLLVVEQGRVTREAAKKVKASLDHVNAKLLGVVLNKAGRSESSYYYYYGEVQ